jgi:DNA-binding MarR family transcriptional regulator
MNHEWLILQDLRLSHPRLLTLTVLRADLAVIGAGLSAADLDGHLSRLEAKGQVVIVTGEDATRVKITAAGLARLAE